MRAIMVTHAHWDREWYRTFQDFRAHLVDLVDRVLDLCAADPGYRFLLDGQTVVLEDYLEIRPGREAELRSICAQGRIALGPWYVQPDSLLPSGEAHVRNLLLGRRVGEAIGSVSREGYTPDSFGHPAQFPQLLSGFGIESFLYWRGHGDEIDALPAEYAWVAPDGSEVLACHLGRGYFNAATSPGADLEEAGARIAQTAKELAERSPSRTVLLLNGIDHAVPEARTGTLAKSIASAGGFPVERGLLEDFVAGVRGRDRSSRKRFQGELVGARVSPLLPGVWSTRTWIKLANRRAEAVLEGWAEPFAALAMQKGLLDERPALDLAWKEVLKNQAHDSICGCSRDEVHEQMRARFFSARELAEQTTTRCLERLGGHGVDRRPPWSTEFDLLVANPSPRTRSDVVRYPLDFHPYVVPDSDPAKSLHPTVLHDQAELSLTVDGVPARLVQAEIGRVKLLASRPTFDLEFVARDVPALGLKRVRVAPAPADMETGAEVGAADVGVEIGTSEVQVTLEAEGCFSLRIGDREFRGLGALEDTGDRGDSYDYDPVLEGPGLSLESVRAEVRRHPSGIQELAIHRTHRLPVALDESRRERSRESVALAFEMVVRVAPEVPRADLRIRLENPARDHRLRMVFPIAECRSFRAATTFDVATREPGARSDEGWVQRAPETFVQQGFVAAGGLSVVAPGLPEAEVTKAGLPSIAITLLRCVGSLSRHDLESRPGPAGPGTDTPGAQCLGPWEANLSLSLSEEDPGVEWSRAREAELGLRAVAAGTEAASEGTQLSLLPEGLVLSALKPAADGRGCVLRVGNPGDRMQEARVRVAERIARASALRLDEEPADFEIRTSVHELCFSVPPHGLRSIRLETERVKRR